MAETDITFEQLAKIAKRDYQAEIISSTRFHINNVAFASSGRIFIVQYDRHGRRTDIPVSTRPRTNLQMRLVMNYLFQKEAA